MSPQVYQVAVGLKSISIFLFAQGLFFWIDVLQMHGPGVWAEKESKLFVIEESILYAAQFLKLFMYSFFSSSAKIQYIGIRNVEQALLSCFAEIYAYLYCNKLETTQPKIFGYT